MAVGGWWMVDGGGEKKCDGHSGEARREKGWMGTTFFFGARGSAPSRGFLPKLSRQKAQISEVRERPARQI